MRITHGFSLLESLIALFILAVIVGVALKHQVFLLKKESAIEDRIRADRQAHNQRLLGGS